MDCDQDSHDPHISVLERVLSLHQQSQHRPHQSEGKGRHHGNVVAKGDRDDLSLAPQWEEQVRYLL